EQGGIFGFGIDVAQLHAHLALLDIFEGFVEGFLKFAGAPAIVQLIAGKAEKPARLFGARNSLGEDLQGREAEQRMFVELVMEEEWLLIEIRIEGGASCRLIVEENASGIAGCVLGHFASFLLSVVLTTGRNRPGACGEGGRRLPWSRFLRRRAPAFPGRLASCRGGAGNNSRDRRWLAANP